MENIAKNISENLNESVNIFLQINYFISENLHNFVIENGLEKIIWFLADVPIFFLPIFFIFSWIFIEYYKFQNKKYFFDIRKILFWEKKFLEEKKLFKSKILLIFYSIIFWILISLIIQQIFFFDRPDILFTPILEHIPDASFPSDHSSVSFAFLFWLLFAWYKKTFYSFFTFVILMNISRIAWWLHWFFDVFAWMIIWRISVLIIFKNNKNKFILKTNEMIFNLAKFFKL